MVRILVTGSRVWTREDLVRGAIQDWLTERYPKSDTPWTELVIIHGACPTGADFHAGRWAFDFDVRQETYPANYWRMYGGNAHEFRNQQMINAGADVCLAFPLGASRGTRDCMRRAAEAGILVKSFENPAIDGYRQSECNCMIPILDGAGQHSPDCAVFSRVDAETP